MGFGRANKCQKRQGSKEKGPETSGREWEQAGEEADTEVLSKGHLPE